VLRDPAKYGYTNKADDYIDKMRLPGPGGNGELRLLGRGLPWQLLFGMYPVIPAIKSHDDVIEVKPGFQIDLRMDTGADIQRTANNAADPTQNMLSDDKNDI